METNTSTSEHVHPPLHEAQEAQAAAVTAWYEKEIMLPNGVVFNGAVYQSDPNSWDTLSKTMSVGKVPDNFYWIDANNNKVPFTFSDLQGLGEAMSQARFSVFDKLQKRKSDIFSATTKEELLSVLAQQILE